MHCGLDFSVKSRDQALMAVLTREAVSLLKFGQKSPIKGVWVELIQRRSTGSCLVFCRKSPGLPPDFLIL